MARKRVKKLIPFLPGQNWSKTAPRALGAQEPGPRTPVSPTTYHRGGPPKNALARRPGRPEALTTTEPPAQ